MWIPHFWMTVSLLQVCQLPLLHSPFSCNMATTVSSYNLKSEHTPTVLKALQWCPMCLSVKLKVFYDPGKFYMIGTQLPTSLTSSPDSPQDHSLVTRTLLDHYNRLVKYLPQSLHSNSNSQGMPQESLSFKDPFMECKMSTTEQKLNLKSVKESQDQIIENPFPAWRALPSQICWDQSHTSLKTLPVPPSPSEPYPDHLL